MKITAIVQEIKKKDELKNLEESFIKERISDYTKKNSINLESLDKRSSAYKELFKTIRKKCFEVYGLFKQKSKDTLEEHISSKERLEFYPRIYKEIFAITGKPKTILDLGCGLNPLSYKELGCKPKYYASELSNEDCNTIKEFFKENKIKGDVFAFDLLKEDYSTLPKVDVCFLFKVLESLEAIKRNISIEILKSIPSKWIIVSFSKKTITGRPIKKKGRSWLRRMLNELNYSYEIRDIGEEIFYIIKKLI